MTINKQTFKYNLLVFLFLLISSACEKEITIDIPQSEEKLVVEGFIEQNMPPIVFLSKNIGYFAPTDLSTLQNLMVKDAQVSIDFGGETYELTQICIDSISESFLPLISELTGLSEAQLKLYNYCFYTSLNPNLLGQVNQAYTLSVKYSGKEYHSTTTIPSPVNLDSIWYKKRNSEGSHGVIWAKLSDPIGYNAYRIFTKRLGKDENYVPVTNSVYEDQFFNGKTFDFYFYRGTKANSDVPTDNNSESAYYREADTIVIKFCSIDREVYLFFRDVETEIANNGNPFAAPSTIRSNISKGGLGYWAGYGAVYDTIIAFE
ncbi:MAG: DUF4249 domain-containing protein [Bacteroidetes bacterium]|nr:DUF4249 domain-containing protein [Bacteroidota bacterium]HET6244469.1 DUF4249 family protein [Bacteroidia bacterium]